MSDNETELLQPLQSELDDRRRAVRVGAIAVVAAFILVGAFLATGPLQVLTGNNVRVDFGFIGPLKPGASVRISGLVVGVVKKVELLAGKDADAGPTAMVRVHARVQDEVVHLVTDKAHYYVTTLGVLGEHYLDIEPVAGGVPLADNARVHGISLARADLLLPRAASLLEKADALVPSSQESRALMESAKQLMGTLDGLWRDEGETDKAAVEVHGLMADLRALVRGAAAGLGDGQHLRKSLERLPGVLDKAEQLEAQALAADLGKLLGDARTVLGRLDGTLLALEGDAQDAAANNQLRRTLISLDAAARRADRLLRMVEAHEGGAGMLFHDEDVAADLKAVLRAVRKDPLRFLIQPK